MKIAGRKNPGAWYRTNKAIKALSLDDKLALQTYLTTELLFLDSYFNDMVSLAAEAGVSIDSMPVTKDDFIASLVGNGIPLQVWMGKLTFTTYTKECEGADAEYIPNYAASATSFGNELRGFMKRYLHANRQVRDVFNLGTLGHGNPGGLPDIDPEQ